MFMAVTCVATLFALGTLVIMHGKNISRGETSVEAHINVKMRKMQSEFKNPYDFGRKKNWRLFLGLVKGRSFWRHVLLPSTHKPIGNGLSFHTQFEVEDDWP